MDATGLHGLYGRVDLAVWIQLGACARSLGGSDGDLLLRNRAHASPAQFALADHVNVVSAGLENGILVVDLKREVPEALKPRKIAIAGDSAAPATIEQKAA